MRYTTQIRVEELCIATHTRDLRENDVTGMAERRFVHAGHSAKAAQRLCDMKRTASHNNWRKIRL